MHKAGGWDSGGHVVRDLLRGRPGAFERFVILYRQKLLQFSQVMRGRRMVRKLKG